MDLKKYLKLNYAQKQLDNFAKKYKNKKIVIYGAGNYFQLIEENYDLSQINIVGITDIKFASDKNLNTTKYLPLAPNELKDYDYDIIAMALINDLDIMSIVDEKILKGSPNENKPILPLISPSLSYIFKLFFSEKV